VGESEVASRGQAAGAAVVVGGTSGIGLELARILAARGREVVVTGRDEARAARVAAKLGERARGVAVDLTQPESVAGALAGLGPVDRLIILAIDRDENRVRDYDIAAARRLVTLKLVGYTEVVHALLPALTDDASILLFGGLAKDRPYPGSTTVSTVNGGITALVRTLAIELAPIRVNALHPGVVSDSPAWVGKTSAIEAIAARTPTGRLPTMADVVDAAVFLLENRSVNGVNLDVDGGWVIA
jgi:NAD(P)-dependent dehydrogenase (short-subunit alcohol dehydrogenase family)